ncbi:MAG: serine/threonine protein kinase [Myxococcales bacterium]|nr:serine/threonine protein kinase [Myxococcales bacterium]
MITGALIPGKLDDALRVLTGATTLHPALSTWLAARWEGSREALPIPEGVSPDEARRWSEAADALDKGLPALTRSSNAADRLAPALRDDRAALLFLWCTSVASRPDVRTAPLLRLALAHPELRERALVAAQERLVQGPLLDALACVPLLGTGAIFTLPENAEARARLEILIWEAGASALPLPELGAWLWQSDESFDVLVAEPARGSLRGRVLAARCLEICVPGLPSPADPAQLGRALQILQPLILHPEPLVSVHAARALGRLAGAVEHLEGMLLDWLGGESLVLRKRGMTALASLPAPRLRILGHELTALIRRGDAQEWALPAAAAGTPYLFHEAREIWDELAERIAAGAGGSVAARALARGLAALWRTGQRQSAVRAPLEELRQMARRARADSIEEWRDWLTVIALTDPVEGAERDPLDVELGLENLVHLAAQYDDEEADARAARFAESLSRTFEEARRIALGQGSLRHRAAGMNALEGCARSMALRLWSPQLATHPRGQAIPEPDLTETWNLLARAPSELLDELAERRRSGTAGADDEALEVLAIRLGGYALDACGAGSTLKAGPTAHDTCRWLRKLEGIADGSRELPSPRRSALQAALSSVFWRLVDTTRGTALGEVDDVEWLGPFAAWWALVIDRPAMLQQLATALPMIQEGALERCCELADAIRSAVASGAAGGRWAEQALEPLRQLHAGPTELAEALNALATSLGRFDGCSGRTPELESLCLELVLAAERLQSALADPVKALHPAAPATDDSLERASTENAPRIAALVARAIRARELGMLDVWFTSLGPVTSALVEHAIRDATARTPPPPPSRKKLQPETLEGYELVRPLGEGGIGKVWLVRKPGADRLFVLKVPKREALAAASDTERAGILASFVEEANALAGIYHPNVANIIDRGVAQEVPFLVLELLIGADLQQYSAARLLSLFELRQVVSDTCAGLAALHGAGLVHRDIKPANIWLRLPLQGGERFAPERHRDPAHTRPLSAVVIDFGMVRPMRITPDAAGRFVAGTPGYIAPDQVLDPVELDGRADVYALAGTIYNVTTGRTFFDDVTSPRDRIFAHMQKLPLEDPERVQGYPAALTKLLRAATALDPRDRPTPLEFGRAFEACL